MAKRAFQMHPKLLVDVIKRQAGSIQKAILEGVMNAIEAGASKVSVSIQPRKVVIDDDGKGFRSMEEIESFFETFGMPHAASENKVWAQFRMGRGQMFAFGRNVWRTGNFRMVVDIDAVAKDVTAGCPSYELQELSENHKGCHIEIDLYIPLSDYETNSVKRELETYVAYVKCPVLVNDVVVNRNPEDCSWDKDSTEDAFIRLSTSEYKPLSIYNLGVFVCDIRQHEIGIGGTVVSKSRLDVNFARNDIIRSDPTWKRIKAAIEKASGLKKVKVKTNLSPAEREAMIRRLMDGDPEVDPWKLKLIEDTNGKAWSLTEIKKHFPKFTIGRRYDSACDKAMQQGIALCVNEENAELFSPRKPEKMLDAINKVFQESWRKIQIPFVPLKEVVKGIDVNHYIITEDKWPMKAHMWARFCTRVIRWATYGNKPRKCLIGESAIARAWTDGSTYIVLNHKMLGAFKKDDCRVNLAHVTRVAITLCHEYCHIDEGSNGDHTHDDAFYQRFHDSVDRWLEIAISEASHITPKNLDEMTRIAKKKSKMTEAEKETPIPEELAAELA